MEIGLILLDKEDKYVYEDGSLPERTGWDKQFVIDMIRDRTVLCSQNTYDTIPPSMKAVAEFTTDKTIHHDINFGISTFSAMPEIMMVTRSDTVSEKEGKTLRLNDYEQIFEDEQGLEIWRYNEK